LLLDSLRLLLLLLQQLLELAEHLGVIRLPGTSSTTSIGSSSSSKG
jgi:hypothetical protein